MNHRVHGTESAIHFIDTNTIAFKGNKGTNDHIASHCLSSLFQYKKKKQVTRQQLLTSVVSWLLKSQQGVIKHPANTLTLSNHCLNISSSLKNKSDSNSYLLDVLINICSMSFLYLLVRGSLLTLILLHYPFINKTNCGSYLHTMHH